MISVSSKATIEDLDAACTLSSEDGAKVKVPTQFPSHTLGLQGSLLQFLITWLGPSKSAELCTYVQSGKDEATHLENFASTVHGLVAILAAGRVASAEGRDITEAAKKRAAMRYAELTRVEVKGRHLLILVADNHPYVQTAAPFVGLAPKDYELRARRRDAFLHDFKFHLNRCIKASGAFPLQATEAGPILETVYELLANSEEWGTTDLGFKPLRNSVRGVTGEIVPLAVLRQHIAQSGVSKPLARYFESLPNTVEATHVLEFSVFDSGVGLAQRSLKQPIGASVALTTEYKAVLNCLRKRITSSNDVTRGMGLFEVMNLLTRLKGFLRIRSGRLALFRDFVEDEFLYQGWDHSHRLPRFQQGFEYMWDWSVNPKEDKTSSGGEMNLVARPLVDGTLLTFWVPLKVGETQLPLFAD